MIRYRYLKDYDTAVEKLKELYAMEREERKSVRKVWQIPVCYDLSFGLDLQEIANEKEMPIEEVIQLHSAPEYLIYFIGFQPGFLYLGGLNEQIHTPRRPNPRLRVAKGSVGIGGEQTGIYPQDASGGWNLIGKSPISFFDINKNEPCFAKAGDRIQFQSVDLDTFQQIEEEVQKGIYELKFQKI